MLYGRPAAAGAFVAKTNTAGERANTVGRAIQVDRRGQQQLVTRRQPQRHAVAGIAHRLRIERPHRFAEVGHDLGEGEAPVERCRDFASLYGVFELGLEVADEVLGLLRDWGHRGTFFP